MNEGDLKKAIKKDLPVGAWEFSPVQTGMGKTGVPDILCCVPFEIKPEHVGRTFGLFVGIEAKMYGKVPTKNQMGQLKDIDAASGTALVATQTEGKKYTLKRIYCD